MKRTFSYLFLFFLPISLLCQKLPITVYTATDGLASPWVSSVMCDSRGFVWFTTRSGINRFDGEQFVTYGQDDGLTDAVMSISEMGDGTYWVGLNNGTSCRFQPSLHQLPLQQSSGVPKPMFEPFSLQVDSESYGINVMYKNSRGEVFIGGTGSFLIGNDSLKKFQRILLPASRKNDGVTCFVSDREGTLWIGTYFGLYRYLPTGKFTHYTISPDRQLDWIYSLHVDKDGRLWIGHGTAGIFVIILEPIKEVTRGEMGWQFHTIWIDEQKGELENVQLPQTASRGIHIRLRSKETKILSAQMYETNDGRMWIGTEKGLLVLEGHRLTLWNASRGFPRGAYYSIAKDHFGNLWIGTTNGAIKIELNGLVKYISSDGIEGEIIHSLYQDSKGNIIAVAGKWFLNYYNGNRFTSYRSRYFEKAQYSWASRVGFLDKHDEWWFQSNQGLLHFPRTSSLSVIKTQEPLEVITQVEGYDFRASFCQYEDKTGSLWISLRGNTAVQNGLLRWNRATKKFTAFTTAQGLPPFHSADAFCDDSAGGIWFGFYQGGIARYYDGKFRFYSSEDGIPQSMITSILFDKNGKLWAGSNQDGVACVDNPYDSVLHLQRYTTKEGLSSNNVRCLVDDQWGRLYIGTARGLDRLEPTTGRIKHYTVEDGLPSEFVTSAFRDRTNTLWFGTFDGLAKMKPEPPTAESHPPSISLSEVQVAGVSYSLSPLGEQSITGLELQPNQTNIQFGFFSIGRGVGEVIRYQYQLKGAEDEWSKPIQERTIHFANLAPGKYEFRVRAVSSDGSMSQLPAHVSFTILPPLTMRWWFRTLMALVVFAVGYGVYRYRVATLLRLERLRLRIASDLHDDVGSALTKIAVHSEIIQNANELKKIQSSSQLIGNLSREIIRTFSDIVWSIDTRHDTYGELTARMKSFALDVLSPKDIAVKFVTDGLVPSDKVSVELRQNLYLIFKEAINNITRHSTATHVWIELKKMHHTLSMHIKDDGQGISEENLSKGHGIRNMKMRAETIKGSIHFENNNGWAVELHIPMRI